MAHRISQIKIVNYKSIVAETFELSNYTPLVGYNNAGKTNILNAIKWLLRKNSLSSEAFYDPALPVEMEGSIEDIDNNILQQLTQNHRTSIQQYIVNGKLQVKRIQNQPNAASADVKLWVFNPAATDPADPWVSNPTGIDNAINLLFPEPIHIGAMENSEEDISKSKTTTTIGKLLAEIIGPIETQYGAQILGHLAGLKDLLDAEGVNRANELTQFDTEANRKIDIFFPDVNIKVHVPTPEIKEVFGKGTIRVYENQAQIGKDISALGNGAQRSIQMALIRHLAELKRGSQAQAGTTLLLIDEPELYLHPQAIEVVRDALKSLSTQNYQVVFSTHSAVMITQDDVADTILVRKNLAQGTHKKQTLKAAIPQVVQDAPSQMQLLFALSNSTNILFSEKVVLSEGKTEQRLIPKIAEKVTGKTLGLHKTAFVPMNGSGNTQKSIRVLDAMALPTKAIVDLDYAFKQGISNGHLPAGDPDITACIQHLGHIAVAKGITLGTDNLPAKSSTLSAAQGFSILAAEPTVSQNIDNIHGKLLAQNIWIWKKGTIEDHLGLTSKDEATWANFCNQLKTTTLQTLVPDHTGVENCISWMIS
ncbi:ATP-dependent endonuclease [Chitinophaga sp. CF418]|uniref:ATP-dependent nuclease n=1 Tax=Chitinophaga sp. CF418 TaxID=1855287 RepID=UPI00090FE37F|nr:AAA family ATPase [Chitinophaga sp. CF418]SHM52375.1 Predicted ATP-dependent endonuclease of the OLD family, contains P-loop ATPase and TOPRIM domains [Chitinophaga sp. CF418]